MEIPVFRKDNIMPYASEQGSMSTEHVIVYYPERYDIYAECIARLLEAALDACVQKFHFLYEHRITVTIEHSNRSALWVGVPEPQITWEFSEERHLLPPAKGGPHNVYGFIHELGHLILWIEDAPSLAQGWADYFGFTLMPLVWEQLGESAWPIPHNYWEIELQRRKNWEERALSNPESDTWAAWYFWQLEQRYGAVAVGEIIRHYSTEAPILERFITTIGMVTGEDAASLRPFAQERFGTLLEEVDWSRIDHVLMVLDTKGNMLVHHVDALRYPGGTAGGFRFDLVGSWTEVHLIEVSFPQLGMRFSSHDLAKAEVQQIDRGDSGPAPVWELVWGWDRAVECARLWLHRHLLYRVSHAATKEKRQWHLRLRCPAGSDRLAINWHLFLPSGAEPGEIEPEPIARQFIEGSWMLIWEWRKPPEAVPVAVKFSLRRQRH